MTVILDIEVKERDAARVKAIATRLVTTISEAGVPFDIEVGGLLWDLMRGCGLSSDEIRIAALEGKK